MSAKPSESGKVEKLPSASGRNVSGEAVAAAEKAPSASAKSASVLKNTEQEYETFAKEQENEFKKIRAVMKTIGNMFYFGKPTPKMLMCLLKLHQEYIAKCKANKERGDSKLNLSCMFGLMEDDKGNLYATISEDPKEDLKYNEKRTMIYSILKQANINVTHHPIDADHGGTAKTITSDPIIGWRGDGKYFKEKDYKDFLLLSNKREHPYDYLDTIRNYPIELSWTDSWKYLQSRRTGKSFSPFKRYNDDITEKDGKKTKYQIVCNNGSTCTEAKLFSFIHNLNEEGEKIKPVSCIAYWIGKDLPPGHILKSYCYDATNTEEKKKLEELTNECITILKKHSKYNDISKYFEFKKIFQNAVQPFALACPGCLANIQKYKNSVDPAFEFNKWNHSKCYEKRVRQITTGGRRTKRRRSHGRKMTHKRV